MSQTVSLKDLVESGAHFGHQTRRWNPKIEEYLYGAREGVHIFDLTKTKEKLEEALKILEKFAKEGKTIIFVGTKKQAKEKVTEVAKEAGVFYITERWLGGTLTNFAQIKRSTQKLADMKAKMQKGDYKSFTKKERLLLDREIQRLERFFSGISEMKYLPDLIVVVDVRKESGTVYEARVMGVPTIGIVDSNSDPTSVDYAIPMNDDASRALDYVLGLMRDAVLAGKGLLKTEDKKEIAKDEKKTESEVAKEPKTAESKKEEKPKAKKAVEKKAAKK
jgi:small subunit ribosomal protein S2